MELNNEQIKAFCVGIKVSDIKEYINNNLDKFQEFLMNRGDTK